MLRVLSFLLAVLAAPAHALAQRELHWQRVDVEALLAADGTLDIIETQTMVFTGDWNGGERVFNIRPRQRLAFHALLRADGDLWRPLQESSSLASVDDFAFTNETTLRWRSRRPEDPPFQRTIIRYQLQYALSGILLKQDDKFVLDHDFLFPDRDGIVEAFTLRLRFAEGWQPASPIREVYSVERVEPGSGFVLTLPLRYRGEGEPAALDTSRPEPVVRAVWALLAIPPALIVWLMVRELRRGRFAPLPQVAGEAWLREHVFAYPAEVIGAAWDDSVGAPEVVALLARMVAEGKLESDVKGRSSMSLQLKVPRDTLAGYERLLVDKLFFDGRTQTSTSAVKQHYRNTGFDPSAEIMPELTARMDELVPVATTSLFGMFTGGLMLVAIALLAIEWFAGEVATGALFAVAIGGVVLAGVGAGIGRSFRSRIDAGARRAAGALIVPLCTVAAALIFLWNYVGLDRVAASEWFVVATTAMALAVLTASIGAMRSRQTSAGVAFRKRLAAARAFFERELDTDQPGLRDEWFPWLLALGLGQRMDDWSVRAARAPAVVSAGSSDGSLSRSSGGRSGSQWTGFGGGRSGGAGAAAAWASAAGSIAATVPRPSSSGSSGGSGGSSGGGSSGGGGGGGW